MQPNKTTENMSKTSSIEEEERAYYEMLDENYPADEKDAPRTERRVLSFCMQRETFDDVPY